MTWRKPPGRPPATDVARLAELVAEAVAEQAEGRGGRIWSARETRAVPAEASLAALVADPDACVLAGTIDDDRRRLRRRRHRGSCARATASGS